MTSSLHDIDKGFRHIVHSMAVAAGSPDAHVVVGWPERTAGSPRTDGSGMTNAAIAAVHEYGAPARGIPERSMLRGTADANQARYIEMTRLIARGVAEGRASLRQGLDLLGVTFKGDMQSRISDGIAPPNSPATIKRKGSSTPLIASGQMRQSIDHEVRGC
ncbi:MAG TPA: hypothetical protein VGO53_16105 [Steroidobacteraceae bacterium]|jgi:hypothetical protein|nr:hypothetical protein [Steroidobacteraceae bacterium]